jgi:hypothetical protein
MLSEKEMQAIDRYLGEMALQLPHELDARQRQTLQEEAARLRAWTRRELPIRKEELQTSGTGAPDDPPIRRQLLYGTLTALFCYAMAGVFYCALIPRTEWNAALMIPLLVVSLGSQAMGRCQQLRRQQRRQQTSA